MISHIFVQRTGPAHKEARQGFIHGFCLSESNSHVKDRLNEDLSEGHSTAP